jgi:hypothetical protein
MKRLRAVQLVIGKAVRVVKVVRRPSPKRLGRPLRHPADWVRQDPGDLPVPPPAPESQGPCPRRNRPRRIRGRVGGDLPPPFKPAPRRPDGTRP